MPATRRFEDLDVWRRAHAWVLSIYRLTEAFPKHELYGLTSQVRRAAVSVPTNIAEGFGRRSAADKSRFYDIAHASLDESRYLLMLGRDLGYADTGSAILEAEEVSRMLAAYNKALLAARGLER